MYDSVPLDPVILCELRRRRTKQAPRLSSTVGVYIGEFSRQAFPYLYYSLTIPAMREFHMQELKITLLGHITIRNTQVLLV